MKARCGKAGQGVPRSAPTEWVWGSLGVGAAAASASFASYMLVFGPGPFGLHGSADFGIFAHLAPRQARPPIETSALSEPGGHPRRLSEATDKPADTPGAVDFSPTGSVQTQKPAADTSGSALRKPAAARSTLLDGFVLRDVFDGKALIESRRALSLVAPGSMVEGAGQVLSIERRGDSWVVNTTGGVISAASR